jgi:hypothetical protein
VLSGDIHFSYATEVRFPDDRRLASRVHQLVNSPIRNALVPPERTAMRLGSSRLARVVGRMFRRVVGHERPPVSWDVDRGPVFANSLGQIDFDGRSAQLLVLQALPHDEKARPELDEVIELDLVAGSHSARRGTVAGSPA